MFFSTYIEYLGFINLLVCGDIKTNPGPFSRRKFISRYQWNLNGLLAHTRVKFNLVEAFAVSNTIDICYISKKPLGSSANNIYDGLNINGYNLVRSDYPSNKRRDGVAIGYKEHLPAIRGNYISSLNESIVLEIRLPRNHSYVASLHRSTNQNKDQSDEIFSNFNMLITNNNYESY